MPGDPFPSVGVVVRVVSGVAGVEAAPGAVETVEVVVVGVATVVMIAGLSVVTKTGDMVSVGSLELPQP